MCGRYASTTTDKELRSLFDVVDSVDAELPPSYNVVPTHQVRVVSNVRPTRSRQRAKRR
ncbi:SOS response-associated peptidase family protein [Rhodococcus sp. (in: high G+C Gram-positive bacteria)]|uniref:SOS response-associated peptidase family protein n=1 Tax=Rhodococcus sp. TaxID=1831 RepID=UPI003B8A9572